jgi:hypothetical protein
LTGPGTNQEKLKAYLAALDATRSPPPELRVSPAEPIPGGGYSSKATLALVGTDSQHLALTADSADGAILLAREVLARAVDKGVSLPVAKEQVLAEKHTKEKAPEPDKGRA